MAGDKNISDWKMKTGPQGLEIETDGSEQDHTRALEALRLALDKMPGAFATAAPQQASAARPITVLDACNAYMLDRVTQITEGTRRTWWTSYNKLIAAFGDRLAHELNPSDISAELARLGVTIAPKTLKKDAQTWAMLWRWLIERGHSAENPVKLPTWGRAQLVRLNQERGRDRQPYSADDIKMLFDATRLSSLVRPEDAWLPTLGLFTGARLEALCRLRCHDFTDNTLRFDAGHDKTGKERVIPLHAHLIAAGVVDYVKEIAAEFGSDSYIFPHLTEIKGRRGHYFSKSFGDQRRALGIDLEKDFHSLRVHLISHLQEHGCPADLRRLYVGHETGERLDVHERTYSKASFTPQRLAELIFPYIRIEWPGWCYKPGAATPALKKIIAAQERRAAQFERKSGSKRPR